MYKTVLSDIFQKLQPQLFILMNIFVYLCTRHEKGIIDNVALNFSGWLSQKERN